MKIKPSLINALFHNQEIFWLIGTDTKGVTIEKSVQAATVKDVLTWAEQEHIQVIGCLPASAIKGALEEMEKVQQGLSNGHENYAYDYDNAEDLKESDVQIQAWSIEEKDKFDEGFLRRCKNYGSYSVDDLRKIEDSLTNMKIARHQGLAQV